MSLAQCSLSPLTARATKLADPILCLLASCARQVCAVVCHGTFSVHMVRAVFPCNLMQSDALRLLHQLEALNLIVGVDDSARAVWTHENERRQMSYTFRSTLVQEVIYKKLPERQRRTQLPAQRHPSSKAFNGPLVSAGATRSPLVAALCAGDLHGKAAWYLAQQRAADTKQAKSAYIPMLAHHYLYSGKPMPALKYLSMAARLAMSVSAYQDVRTAQLRATPTSGTGRVLSTSGT